MQAGATLVAANDLSDGDGLGPISYQWLRDGQEIAGANQSNYTLTSADVGRPISVRASYTDGGKHQESKTSLATAPVAAAGSAPSYRDTLGQPEVEWAGLKWYVRDSDWRVGAPMANGQWSRNNVRFNGSDMQLALTNTDGKTPVGAEIISSNAMGYGTYQGTFSGDFSKFDKYTVFGGFFTFEWAEPSVGGWREIDAVEVSRWGKDILKGSFTYYTPTHNQMNDGIHMPDYLWPASFKKATMQLEWRPGKISWTLRDADSGKVLHRAESSQEVPDSARQQIHFNLWSLNLGANSGWEGAAPQNVTVHSFNYTPLNSNGGQGAANGQALTGGPGAAATPTASTTPTITNTPSAPPSVNNGATAAIRHTAVAKLPTVNLQGVSSVREGGTARYTVSLSQPASRDVAVTVEIQPLGLHNRNITAETRTLTIAKGRTAQHFDVKNRHNRVADGNKPYRVILKSANGAALASAISPNHSRGHGGGGREQQFTGAGLSSRYRIINPENAAKGLVLYLHGDGVKGYPSSLPQYAEQARAKGFALLVPQTPDTASATWWKNGTRNAAYLRALLEDIYRKYNVNRGNVWLVGYSGGAELISYYLLPQHNDLFSGGGALLVGGGGMEIPLHFGKKPTDDLKSRFPMKWLVGSRDNGADFDALTASQQGRDRYAAAGFHTRREIIPGVDHIKSGDYGAAALGALFSGATRNGMITTVIDIDGGAAAARNAAATPAQAVAGVKAQVQPALDENGNIQNQVNKVELAPQGAMLDVARQFYSLDELKAFIDDVAAGGGKFFHLHLSDNENYTLESAVLGQTAENSQRNQDGSYTGPLGNNFYSKEQIAQLNQYASAKGVQLIPEIDLPGHADFIYKLLQRHDAARAAAAFDGKNKEAAAQLAQELYGEAAEQFSASKYFHMGGNDFAGAASQNADYIAYVNGNSQLLKSKGLQPMIWNDGVLSSSLGKLDKAVTVSYHTGGEGLASAAELEKAGYQLFRYGPDAEMITLWSDKGKATGGAALQDKLKAAKAPAAAPATTTEGDKPAQ